MIEKGDKIQLQDGRKGIVKRVKGKMIYFKLFTGEKYSALNWQVKKVN